MIKEAGVSSCLDFLRVLRAVVLSKSTQELFSLYVS